MQNMCIWYRVDVGDDTKYIPRIIYLLRDSLQWCHNEPDGVSNHQPHYCFLKRLFRHRSKKLSKLRVTGLCEGNSPATGEFPAQRVSNTENVSIWWRHHDFVVKYGRWGFYPYPYWLRFRSDRFYPHPLKLFQWYSGNHTTVPWLMKYLCSSIAVIKITSGPENSPR